MNAVTKYTATKQGKINMKRSHLESHHNFLHQAVAWRNRLRSPSSQAFAWQSDGGVWVYRDLGRPLLVLYDANFLPSLKEIGLLRGRNVVGALISVCLVYRPHQLNHVGVHKDINKN